jgi:hypothetical protein
MQGAGGQAAARCCGQASNKMRAIIDAELANWPDRR